MAHPLLFGLADWQERRQTMGVSGERFFALSGADTLCITEHALERIEQHCGIALGKAEAYTFLCGSSLLKAEQLMRLGYRPGYDRRKRRGEESWYFRFLLDGEELVAVLSRGGEPGEFVWRTTYGRNPESDLRRMTFSENRLAA